MRHAWLALGVNLALICNSLLLPSAEAATQLHILLAAEGPPTAMLPPLKICPNRPNLLVDQAKSIELYFDAIKDEAASISQTVFDKNNTILVETFQVNMDEIGKELLREKGNKVIGPTKDHDVDHYLRFLRWLNIQDMHLLEAGNALAGQKIREYCNLRGNPIALTRAFWNSELVRKWGIEDYFFLISWYVRERVKNISPDRESYVPVVLYPMYAYMVPITEDRKRLLSSLKGILRGGKVSPEGAKKFYDANAKATMRTAGEYYPYDSGTGRKEKFPPFARNHRAGFWTYYGWDKDSLAQSMGTFTHELGHYLGLAHVFTSDKTECGDIDTKGSFVESWSKAVKADSKEQKQALCECFFKVEGKELLFKDYDGISSGVTDTSLAIYDNFIQGEGGSNKEIIYFSENCRVSKRYTEYFTKTSQEAKLNYMTYKRPDSGLELSAAQKMRAKEMLDSFR